MQATAQMQMQQEQARRQAELEAQLEAHIHSTFRRAMRDRIVRTVGAPASEVDARWVVSLLRELSQRLKALTPRRTDLHAELDFDAALVEQMLRHGAADADDLRPFADAAVRRMRLLCAPVQDESVRALAEGLAAASDASEALALLLCQGDEIVGEIERLLEGVVRHMEERRRVVARA